MPEISSIEKVQEWKAFTKANKLGGQMGGFPSVFGIAVWENPEPLPFCDFSKAATSFGVQFGVTWGFLMHVTQWRQTIPAIVQFGLAAGAGCLFGLSMAYYARRLKAKHGLTSWEHFRFIAADAGKAAS